MATYDELKAYIATTQSAMLREARVNAIEFMPQEGRNRRVTRIAVDGLEPVTNEPVLAIFYDESRDGLFYVVTQSRGCLNGMPLLYGRGHEAREVT